MTEIIGTTRSVATAILAAFVLTACSGPANERIATFAQSGVTFAKEAPGVYDYAFKVAVDRESADLTTKRAQIATMSARQREVGVQGLDKTLEEQNKVFAQRLKYIESMKSHAGALQIYFANLANLAGAGPGEQVAAAASGAAARLESLAPTVGNIELSGKKLAEIVTPLSKIVVGLVANAQLQTHLGQHGGAVDRAIGLQGAMFEALLEIENDRAIVAEEHDVRSALLNVDGEFPTDWPDRRLRLFALQLQKSPISAGRDAAHELRASFRDLLANGDGALARLQEAVVLVEAVKAIFDKAE